MDVLTRKGQRATAKLTSEVTRVISHPGIVKYVYRHACSLNLKSYSHPAAGRVLNTFCCYFFFLTDGLLGKTLVYWHTRFQETSRGGNKEWKKCGAVVFCLFLLL